MTTLYKPVKIESAEQAEALPDGAIVIGVETGERYTRAFEGDWWGVTEMGTRLAVDLDAGDAVMALVPTEAVAADIWDEGFEVGESSGYAIGRDIDTDENTDNPYRASETA